jgi:hypothetical protein
MDPGSVLPELPTATPTPLPSDTPAAAVTPAEQTPGLPGTGEPILAPSATPQPVELLPTDTPTLVVPTPTPVPTNTPTATAPPTPFVIVNSGLITLRSGPGVEYPLLAQLGPNLPVAIIGRTVEGDWWEICCVSGQSVWVAAQHVTVVNDVANVPPSLAGPPPTPTETGTPTITPTVTPTPTATPYPFQQAIGPQFFPTNNEFLTIWVKLFVGVSPTEAPAEGYYITVKFEGFERPNSAGNIASANVFQQSAPPGSGSRVSYNLKYEYRPPDPKALDPNSTQTPLQLLGTGTWVVYVSDGAGRQLSPEVTFTTAPSNPNREIYIGFVRVG